MKDYMIKVCGMTGSQNITEVESLGIDLMGFIFWPKSKRAVKTKPAYLPQRAKRVGVFVDEAIDGVIATASEYALDFIQLHGKESPAYIADLRQARLQQQRQEPQQPLSFRQPQHSQQRLQIIKAFNIASPEDLTQTEPYEGAADVFLFDTKGKLVGGNGEKFDWAVLDHYKGTTPFLLSGGIGPQDAQRVKDFTHPRCIGIDLNSRFESAPGIKDVEALRAFIQALKNDAIKPETTDGESRNVEDPREEKPSSNDDVKTNAYQEIK